MHMKLVPRGRENGVRDAGIRITPEEMNRKYGSPPYTHPSEVPPMQRMLIAMFAHGAREGVKGNLDMLHKFAAEGLLPDGSFEAWGIPLHPAYAYDKLHAVRKNRSHARPNHHLTDPHDRIEFVRRWRDDLKEAGHCDAANVLSRFLMAYDQSDDLLAGTSDNAEMRARIAEAAYQWVYAYGKSIGMTPNDLVLGYAPARHNLSPETKRKMGHAASRAGHYAGRAARGAAKVTSGAARGLADLLDELAAPPAASKRKNSSHTKAARTPAPQQRIRKLLNKLPATDENRAVAAEMMKHDFARSNAHTVADKPLPRAAQQALNDYAKAHGYNYVHAQIMSPRKVEAYLLQHEGDNFGMRVVATGSVLGRWEVKPFSPGAPRKNLNPHAAKNMPKGPSHAAMVGISQEYLRNAPPKRKARKHVSSEFELGPRTPAEAMELLYIADEIAAERALRKNAAPKRSHK
jgi:hypothetical protein